MQHDKQSVKGFAAPLFDLSSKPGGGGAPLVPASKSVKAISITSPLRGIYICRVQTFGF